MKLKEKLMEVTSTEIQTLTAKRDKLGSLHMHQAYNTLFLEANTLLLKKTYHESQNHLNEAKNRPRQWLALGVGLLIASLALRKKGPYFLGAGCTLSLGCCYQSWKKCCMAEKQLILAEEKLSKCVELKKICDVLQKTINSYGQEFKDTANSSEEG